MTKIESSVIVSRRQTFQNIENHYRLLQSIDCFHHHDIFSIFITTTCAKHIDEDFIYDISRDAETASAFFTLICNQNVTALTLREIAEDFLAEH